MATTAVDRVREASSRHGARRKAGNTVEGMARLGLAARGIVYLLVGWIAIRIALEGSGQQADRQGALQTVAHHTGGAVVLWAMAVGFAGYALWRATEVFSRSGDDGSKKWAKRAVSAGRAVLYGSFAVSTAHAAMSGQSGSGSNSTSKSATAGVLAHPGGRALVIAAGAGFIVAGIVLAVRGVLRKFEKELRTWQMSRRVEAAVAAVGVAGQTARGVIFAVIGGFLIDAAVSYDPHKAQGLDGALRSLAGAPGGKAALVAVAAGLACFGVYSLAEARYRRT
jgi:hypothetical protein